MKLRIIDPPRAFEVGWEKKFPIFDCAHILLDDNEQVTFETPSGAEYDVARKNWGFYATPSLNGRLARFGWRPVLVKNRVNQFFLLLVEQGKEELFEEYRRSELFVVVSWLEDSAGLKELEQAVGAGRNAEVACPMCGGKQCAVVHAYRSPPDGEVRFDFGAAYFRELVRCNLCGHFLSRHQFDLQKLYERQYVDSTYGDGFAAAFRRIISLPPERSDNYGRVNRVCRFAEENLERTRRTVLDVGSGLCVFLDQLKRRGWNCTALDPDQRAVEHAVQEVGVRAIQGDFLRHEPQTRFDVVTFNKVLEHVRDPALMLRRALTFLRPDGFVYLELPDGENAARDGFGREEFFVEHFHVFSAASTALLARQCGFSVSQLESIREPSSKYTIFAFLQPRIV